MMVTTRGSVLRLLAWQWRSVSFMAASSAAVTALHELLHLSDVKLPTLPLAVVGAALGIFVSFRTNSAYARWWEGRQLWGRLVNTSRHFALQVTGYLRDADAARALVHRQIGYVHVLRCRLRAQDPWQDERVRAALPDEARAALAGQRNPCHALLQQQMADLVALAERGSLDPLRLQSLDGTLAAFLDVQGGCERLKNTPMPRGYGFIAERLITAYALLFPLAVVGELGWLTIPVSVLVCLSFALISEAGRVLEDPFSLFWNGLPLAALSATIEADLRQRLGETELPPVHVPDAHGILM